MYTHLSINSLFGTNFTDQINNPITIRSRNDNTGERGITQGRGGGGITQGREGGITQEREG